MAIRGRWYVIAVLAVIFGASVLAVGLQKANLVLAVGGAGIVAVTFAMHLILRGLLE